MKSARELTFIRCVNETPPIWKACDRDFEVELPGDEKGPDEAAMDFYDIVATSFSRLETMKEGALKMLSDLVTLTPDWDLAFLEVKKEPKEPTGFVFMLYFIHPKDLYGLWDFRFILRNGAFYVHTFTRTET